MPTGLSIALQHEDDSPFTHSTVVELCSEEKVNGLTRLLWLDMICNHKELVMGEEHPYPSRRLPA